MSYKSKKEHGDVKWCIPKRKTPIAYSTRATNSLIITIMDSQDTIQSLRNKITYDVEAKQVLDEYINRGYGNQIACKMFR